VAICLLVLFSLPSGEFSCWGLAHTLEKDGVSVEWTSARGQDLGTPIHTWQIRQGESTTVVVGTLDFADPLAPTWNGTVDSQPSSGDLLLFEQDDATVGLVLLDRNGATLVYFDAPEKVAEAMLPGLDGSAPAMPALKCVCWPPRTGNGSCSTDDCDKSESCNSLGSTCMYRQMVVPVVVCE